MYYVYKIECHTCKTNLHLLTYVTVPIKTAFKKEKEFRTIMYIQCQCGSKMYNFEYYLRNIFLQSKKII